MFLGEESCPGNCLFAQVAISDFEGGDELKESSEVKGSLGPYGIQVGTGAEQLTGPQHSERRDKHRQTLPARSRLKRERREGQADQDSAMARRAPEAIGMSKGHPLRCRDGGNVRETGGQRREGLGSSQEDPGLTGTWHISPKG